jgi:quinol monooxygenase YgiN
MNPAEIDQMVVIASKLTIKPENRAEFIRLSTKLAEPTRREPGCLTYSFYEEATAPNQFLFFEQWRTRAAFDAHHAAPPVQAYEAQIPGWLAAPVRVQVMGLRTLQEMSQDPSRPGTAGAA